jgi:hypothetical protein
MFATEVETRGIPQGLDTMPVGPKLAAILSTIDVDRLTGRDVIMFARAQARQISHDQARQYQALSRVGDLYEEQSADVDLYEFAAAEVGAALTKTRRRADMEMGIAHEIVKQYPALFVALHQGRIDLAKVRTILRGVGHVDTEVAATTIDLILPEAPDLTTGQIAARLQKLVIEADPDEAKKAYEEGVDTAKVWSFLEPDGTGTMISTGMEAHDLSAANRNINGIARRMKNDGDDRSIDKIRSDVFARLLSGAMSATARKGQVTITGDVATFAGLNDLPGDLNGFGPVVADVVRQIAREQPDATWVYEVSDSETGEVHVGTTSRRPTSQQKRELAARYKTCVHPGCRFDVAQCDVDHTKDRALGGLTTLCNLAPLCRTHHRPKHQTRWSYRKLPDGTIEWTSQFGFTYLTHPP